MLDKVSASQNRFVVAVVTVIIAALTLSAYITSLQALPLLDEIYLLDLMKARSSYPIMEFLTAMIDWYGPLPEDTWGLVGTSILCLLANLSSQSLCFLRAVSISVHAANAVIFFFVARDALAPPGNERPVVSTYLAATAALVFATYPLAPEAVSWLGGLAYEIGCTFWLTAFYLYLKGKHERNWTILGVAWISFFFAVLSDNSLWSSGFIVVALEMARSFIGPHLSHKEARVPTQEEVFEDKVDRMLEDESKGLHERVALEAALEDKEGHAVAEKKKEGPRLDTTDSTSPASAAAPDTPPQKAKVYDEGDSPDDLFDTLTPALPFIVLGVLISIRALPATGNEQLPGGMIAGFSDWGRVLRHLFFPINRTICQGFDQSFTQLCILYAIPLMVAVPAFIRNKQFRQNAAFLFAWLIMIVVPHLHTALSDSSLLGSRLAYSTLLPASGLIALIFFAPAYAIEGLDWSKSLNAKRLAMAFSAILIGIFLPLSFSNTWAQNCAYQKGAIWLDALSKSARSITRKVPASFVFIRDVPQDVAIEEQISPERMLIFDGEKGLIRAPVVPGGQLKDALEQGKYQDLIVRWSRDQNSLVEVDLDLNGPALKKLDAQEIKRRLVPASESVSYNESSQDLEIANNSKGAPLISIDADCISPLGDDFVYIDCKITAPKDDRALRIEMSWLTTLQKQKDKSRLSQATSIIDDGRLHRYYLPIRSIAWSTNGPITNLTFEFPGASSVIVKEIGTAMPTDRLPKLSYVTTESKSEGAEQKEPLFSSLTYNYPKRPDLGLITLERKSEEITLQYNTSMIPSAQGCLVEITRVNHFFDEPNSDELIQRPLKTLSLEKSEDKIKLSEKDFKVDGFYSIRVFAIDKEGKLLANSSDEINLLIYTRPYHS